MSPEEMQRVETALVTAIVRAYREKRVPANPTIMGVMRREGRFVLRTDSGSEHGANPLGVLALDLPCDETIPLWDDLVRTVGDPALAVGIIRGFEGMAHAMPEYFINDETDRRLFNLGLRVGRKARQIVP